MSYTERTYIQNTNGAVRNKDILNIRMTSDWCEFTPPTVDFNGAVKIQPLSASSEGVHFLTGQTTIDLGLTFTGGQTPYSATSTDSIVEVYKYNKVNSFVNPYVYQSDNISLSGDVSVFTSGYTLSIPVESLPADNQYLIKAYFEFDSCTEFLGILNTTYNNRTLAGDEYSFYNSDFDYYIVVTTPADTPKVGSSSGGTGISSGSLAAYSIFPDITGQTEFVTRNYVGEIMVSLNGITLANPDDYTYSGNVITISGGTLPTDVVTIVHTQDSGVNGLKNDIIEVGSITSGATDGQGTNDVYYNTTEGKYEAYTSSSMEDNSDLIVSLNGITLASGIDYYKSTSNDRRIIFEGTILDDDIINIFYYTDVTFVDGIFTNTPTILWTIETPPQAVNGTFNLQVSTESSFSSVVFSSESSYVVGQTVYEDSVTITGSAGTEYYYRVVNEKFYQPITGNTIDTIAYSDIIPIRIQTNAINSY